MIIMKNDNELSIEEIKTAGENAIAEFQANTEKEIARIKTFTNNNFNELLTMIFRDCQDITEIEEYTEILKRRIENNLELKERLIYQRTLSKKDIIDENIIKMYIVYNMTLAAVWLTSADMLVFIKNFLIATLIEASTFDINLRYFASEYRKKQIANTLIVIDKNIESDKYNIGVFNKFHDIYIQELTQAVIKLFEINRNHHDGYKRIEKFLNDMQIEFLLDNNTIKRKIRKK